MIEVMLTIMAILVFADQKLTRDAHFNRAQIAAQNDGNIVCQRGYVFPYQQHSILAREFVVLVQMNVDDLHLKPWGLSVLDLEGVWHLSRLSLSYSYYSIHTTIEVFAII